MKYLDSIAWRCPNCGDDPVGSNIFIWSRGVSIGKALRGYLRCAHCDTLLRQKVIKHGWTAILLWGLLLVAFAYLAGAYGFSQWIVITGFVLFMVTGAVVVIRFTKFRQPKDPPAL